MATKPSVQKNTGIFSVAFCVVILLLGYTYYLIQTNRQLDVQAMALASSWYQLKPHWAKVIVAGGGYVGTLAALLLIMFQGLMYCGVAYLTAYVGLRQFGKKPASAPASPSTNTPPNGVNSAEIKGSELMVMLPKYPGAAKGELLGGAIDKQPYKQDFYRIDQALVQTKEGVEMSIYKRLTVAIYGMLKAHPTVPASIGGHHADAPLFEHSLTVAKKMQAHFVGQGKSEPLAYIAGLAHDMDKLLAYKQSGDKWVKNVNATHHNKYAAYIVSTQPAFHELPEDDRNCLVLALRYYHDPENLPIGASNRTESLIKALRFCDGYAIQEEKAAGIDSLTDENLDAVEKALLNTVRELNINGYMSSSDYAGGWTTPALDYVITPMSTVLEMLGKYLPAELTRKLQLGHGTRTFAHPAAKVLCERLNKLGLLMTSYKTFTSEIGLYDSRVGGTRFRSVLMLQKSVLDELAPGLIEKWGTPAYGIRITGAAKDMTVQEDSDVDDDVETEKEA
ncbi:HD domain-containing protein [Pseudomonas tritici]|uniref:HD domain-containing protein n=1 Tax=Pseudomonas tritici TaxID=2745518 RepID=UPI00387B0733